MDSGEAGSGNGQKLSKTHFSIRELFRSQTSQGFFVMLV